MNRLTARTHPLQKGLPLETQIVWVELDLAFGARLTGMGAWGDPAHMARRSCHNTGHAIDAMTFRPEVHRVIVAWALENRTRFKIRRIISKGQRWSDSSGWKPVAYHGTDPHESHVHLSINCDL